ncbi:MAG: hypothetical protein IJ309_06070 [Clostridia bacterium]|nr:hypothetical protein [Clostridia bacterium]
MVYNDESIGFLTVAVKTANGALPIENASVAIYGHSELDENDIPNQNPSDVIYSLRTDRNGLTEKVALKTKPKELSEVPGNEFPYLGYNIFISADGYYDSAYVNVPIFQGVTSIQPVNLIPLSEFSAPNDIVPNDGRSYNENTNK